MTVNAETGHTPGPWRYKPTRDSFRIYSAQIGDNSDGVCVADTYYDNSGDEEANAFLIASAPELLEAAKFALASAVFGAGESADLLRAAIAKAEGQETAP